MDLKYIIRPFVLAKGIDANTHPYGLRNAKYTFDYRARKYRFKETFEYTKKYKYTSDHSPRRYGRKHICKYMYI